MICIKPVLLSGIKNNYFMKKSDFIEKILVANLAKKILAFVEPIDLLPSTPHLPAGSYPKPD
jgi:hypothetical protein